MKILIEKKRCYRIVSINFLMLISSIFLLTNCVTNNNGNPTQGSPTDRKITELNTENSSNYSTLVTISPVSTSFEKPITSITPSEAPLLILDEQSAQQEIIRLMETNDDCSNTCFWGITPENTKFDDAIEKLLSIRGVGYEQTFDLKRYYYSSHLTL